MGGKVVPLSEILTTRLAADARSRTRRRPQRRSGIRYCCSRRTSARRAGYQCDPRAAVRALAAIAEDLYLGVFEQRRAGFAGLDLARARRLVNVEPFLIAQVLISFHRAIPLVGLVRLAKQH